MDDILDRIAKLQSLASRPGTPEEAEAAAAKVQTLLLRHNLTLADVESHAAGLGEIAMTELPAQDSIWRAKLLGVVATAHLCRAVRSGTDGRPEKFTILGHPHNLRVVQSVYPWLAELVPDMTLAAMMEHQTDAKTIGVEVWLHSFRLGMIDGIRQAYDAARAAVNDETALVPIDTAVDAAVKEVFPDAQPHRFGGEADSSAYREGLKAGRAVNTERQLQRDAARRLPTAKTG
jgi:hypothetical protein